MFEEIDAPKLAANALNSIGIIHYRKGNVTLALQYFKKSLEIKEEVGTLKEIAGS